MAQTPPATGKVEKLNQVGLIVKDIQDTVQNYWNILGIGPHVIVTVEPMEGYTMTYGGRASTFKFKASFCRMGPVELELIQSLKGPNLYEDHLAAHCEGANHLQSLARRVAEVEQKTETMSEAGFPLLMGGRFGDEVGFAYIDTTSALKTIWELVKMPDEPESVPETFPPGDPSVCPAKIKVEQIYRIGLVARDLEKTAQNYQRMLGIGPWEITTMSSGLIHGLSYHGRAVNSSWKVARPTDGSVPLELIQPVYGDNIFSDFMAAHGEGIHHIQFLVDDIEKTNRIMIQEGFPVLMGGGLSDGGFAYYDTLGPLKIIWQAVQQPRG